MTGLARMSTVYAGTAQLVPHIAHRNAVSMKDVRTCVRHSRPKGIKPANFQIRAFRGRSQPGKKVSLTAREALSEFGSRRAIDCHVPRVRRPETTGTLSDGGATIGTR